MTPEEIEIADKAVRERLENMKLIGVFMDHDPECIVLDFDFQLATGRLDFMGNPEVLAYDMYWADLMQVIEKIESIGFIVEIWLCLAKGCKIMRQSTHRPFFSISTESTSTIDAVYNAVVQFVKWYNQQSTTGK